MPRYANLAEALKERALRCPDGTALAHPAPDGTEHHVSYAALDARADAVAAWLRARDATGRRVLLAMDPGPCAAVALLGCLYAGAVAVPVPAPSVSRTDAERTASIVRDAAVDLVLTETAHATETSRRLSRIGRAGLTCLAVDGLRPDASADTPRQPLRTTADSLALLAYDSGPATAPRGALLTHGNLTAAMAGLRRTLGTDRRSRIGGWLPRCHTPGLIGQVLHPLWLGATAVTLPAEPYRTDPLGWLRAISRHGITETLAPDILHARCAALLDDEPPAGLDLSRWRTALNAGEPVSAGTMAAFPHRCAPLGLRPGTLVAGYVPAEGAPVPLATGRAPVPGADFAVVDPLTGRRLPDGAPGEIWVRGPAVATGHWGRPSDTALLFAARVAEGPGGFLRTGDLGLTVNGRLRMTGRVRDALLVDGRTLHPQDVERELLGCAKALGSARVFCAGPGAGALVVVQEVVRTAGGARTGLPRLAARIRALIAEEFGVETGALLLVRPGTVRGTGTAKIRRALLRERYLRGEVRALHAEFGPGVGEPCRGGAA
ncbi:AMP-binding protein [Streptomyces sp. MK37H]|uniref:AMP-binding protein n=1 Tax=Streptomyces sp. MK37H TaxID=2699117 RepID=UPI001B38A328|nr:AMP-binding protein [Streptomyces sp. MK37H]MBP8538646.1 AMP-binding protein [Streptomyces sp. MK37H]